MLPVYRQDDYMVDIDIEPHPPTRRLRLYRYEQVSLARPCFVASIVE